MYLYIDRFNVCELFSFVCLFVCLADDWGKENFNSKENSSGSTNVNREKDVT